MYQSFFTYNVTKPYPYRWFTWLVVFGGIATTALFTVVNLAANGYDARSNPNTTENPEHPAWFQKKPWSLTSKISSTCQSQAIDIGGQYYTNNFAFPYRVIGMRRAGDPNAAVSFSYHNDHIRACWVTQIFLYMDATQIPPITAKAFINCTMYDDSATATMLLAVSTTFQQDKGPFDPPSTDQLPEFLAINNQTQASIAWGRAMSDTYCTLLEDRIPYMDATHGNYNLNFSAPTEQDDTQVSGLVTFNLSATQQTNLRTEIFPLIPSINKTGRMSAASWGSTFGLDMLADHVPGQYVKPLDRLALSFDGLAKSFYAIVMADLGQSVPSNIVVSPPAVLSFANKTCDLIYAIPDHDLGIVEDNLRITDMCKGGTDGDPAQLFDFMHTGVPRVDPAIISTRYLCQIPKLKSTGSLLVSIIVADLVFLQVVWLVLNWVTTVVVERRDPTAMHCSGSTVHGALRRLKEAESSVESFFEKPSTVYNR